MTAYYNEIDPNAAEWLRQLIKLGAIAPGDVDERDIRDVTPDELAAYTQCHLFAGVGVWSYALRQAGWDDSRPVWTGSCPCQPFSTAGKGEGFADERHLWPAFFWLICQCRPETIIGEQVASERSDGGGLTWWDLVQDDLEGENYAATAFDLPAASIGAPHGRQRLYWVANSTGQRLSQSGSARITTMGKKSSARVELQCERPGGIGRTVGNASSKGLQERQRNGRTSPKTGIRDEGQAIERTGLPTGGFWSDAIWLPCADGKARPAKPGAFPLVDGLAADLVCSSDPGASPHQVIQTEDTSEARTMRLKGYGNAIVGPLATEFISAYMESLS